MTRNTAKNNRRNTEPTKHEIRKKDRHNRLKKVKKERDAKEEINNMYTPPIKKTNNGEILPDNFVPIQMIECFWLSYKEYKTYRHIESSFSDEEYKIYRHLIDLNYTE